MSEFPVRPLWPYVRVQQGYPFESEDFNSAGELPLVRIRDLLNEEFATYIDEEVVPSTNYLVDDGDLLIGMDGDFNSITWHRGQAALNQRVCKVMSSSTIDSRFLAYAIRRPLTKINELRYATTVKHLSQDDIYGLRIPMPSVETQRRIADYLDKETAEIDAMLHVLDEYSSLTQDSLEVWIREISSSDEYGNAVARIPLKLLFNRISSGTTPRNEHSYTSGKIGMPWVTTSELRETEIYETDKNVSEEAIAEIGGLTVYPPGSILVAMYGATIGRFGILGVSATCNQACCVLSEPRGVTADYVFHILFGYQNELVKFGQGGGQPNISQRTVGDFAIPVPSLLRQNSLSRKIRSRLETVGNIKSEIAALRSLLLKRRQVLINDVVTGKKQV